MRYVQDGQTGQYYEAIADLIGSITPGVTVTSSTSAPATAAWFISTGSSTGALNNRVPIFQLQTQANIRYYFQVQSNPSGPYYYSVQLFDNSGTPIAQTGIIFVFVYDQTLTKIKETLLKTLSQRAQVSGVGTAGGLIQNSLTYTFGVPGSVHVTDPSDIIQVNFLATVSGQNGIYAPNSQIIFGCDNLSPTTAPPQGTPVEVF